MTKYDYIGLFEASGGTADNALPATQTKSLSEAVGYLAAINNGELRAPALIEGESGNVITIVAVVQYEAINGKSDEKIYALLDKSIDNQIQDRIPVSSNNLSVDANDTLPRV